MLTLGRIVAALLSGALLAQSYGLHPFWPLAWIAPIPLLIAVMGATRLGAFLYGALAGALSTALMASYFLDLGGLAPTAIITLMKALIWGAIAFAVRGGARHLPSWAAVLVFPTLMAGVEALIAATSPHGSAGSLAYSQIDFLPAIQVASLGGAPAIVFVLSAFASAVAFLTGKRAIAAAAPVVIVAAAIGFGFTRHLIDARDEPLLEAREIGIALLAGDDLAFDAADWRPTWEGYVNEVSRAADDGARIIVLPEKIVTLGEGQAQSALDDLAAIARQHHATIVVGAVERQGDVSFNRAYFVTAEGVRTYDKHHMIPGLESEFTPGTATLFTDVDGLRAGVVICKDMDFPALSRRYGEQGADLLLVPAWDFGVDGWLHSRMAVLRGVESGFTLIRSAREGVMTISDPYGQVLAEAPSGSDIASLTDRSIIQPRHVPTLYTRIGDAFGWFCAALALVLIGWTILARRRAGQGA
ncbi:apolipoprotein N-acyltransferase [Terricaulis silvestris]|uniref:(R)-stereoselective amidase n=1 Tax=Terricaulis silvestris TaxID=2686094 RepID=A0A6I6MRZ1_9CAUL|nr:nitrilase-related carbon-nitrogen hydrolase [Terricaulis silvestris]QGZ96921.1 (R)-stereoselective amidase [Terricaulis silvestris]